MKKRIKLISSFFYLGHSPVMPGSIGSLGGLMLYFLVKNNEILYGFTILFVFFLGMIFSGEAEKIYKHKDARMIVIDEACGMLLALFCVPFCLYSVILGFFIFRILDIVKVWPSRNIEKMAGATGVMFDDIVAGVYTNVLLQIVFRYLVGYCIKA